MSKCVSDPELERGEDTHHPRLEQEERHQRKAGGSALKEIMMRTELSLNPSALHTLLWIVCYYLFKERNSTEMHWDSGQSPAPCPYGLVWSQCRLCTCNEWQIIAHAAWHNSRFLLGKTPGWKGGLFISQKNDFLVPPCVSTLPCGKGQKIW